MGRRPPCSRKYSRKRLECFRNDAKSRTQRCREPSRKTAMIRKISVERVKRIQEKGKNLNTFDIMSNCPLQNPWLSPQTDKFHRRKAERSMCNQVVTEFNQQQLRQKKHHSKNICAVYIFRLFLPAFILYYWQNRPPDDWWERRQRGLNLEWKIYHCVLSLGKFRVAIWQTTSKNCTKVRVARAAQLFFLIQPVICVASMTYVEYSSSAITMPHYTSWHVSIKMGGPLRN